MSEMIHGTPSEVRLQIKEPKPLTGIIVSPRNKEPLVKAKLPDELKDLEIIVSHWWNDKNAYAYKDGEIAGIILFGEEL